MLFLGASSLLGNGHVGNGDVGNVQSHLSQQADSSNFRDDVTINGRINHQDVQTARFLPRAFLAVTKEAHQP
ncbi:MAG: hypothetical protein ACR2II_02125 [Chthoniobacterales bacterium]